VTDTRVLIVDDEAFFRELVSGHLRQNGYEVDTAPGGEAALEKLRAGGSYAVLITDLTMPGLGGLELLRLARRHDPTLEVIVFTADDTVDTAVSALREYGAYDYVLKPLTTNTRLLAAVERAVEYRRLNQEREALKSEVIAHADRLQALIASTEDAIVSADASEIITIINPASVKLFGRVPLVGGDALKVLPEPFAGLIGNWTEVLRRQSAVVDVEWNGANYRVSLAALPGGANFLSGWVMVITDVSQFKRLEEFRLHLLHDAANKIQLPLFNALSTVAELEQLPDSQNSRTTKTLLGLNRHLSQIRRWVDEVLLTARVDGGIGLQPAALDVPALVREWEQTARAILRDHDPRLRVAVADDLPRLYADRELVLRFLRHLLELNLHKPGIDQQHQLYFNFKRRRGQLWIDLTLDGPTVRETGSLRLPEFDASPDRPMSDIALVISLANKLGGQVWVRGRRPAGAALTTCLPAMEEDAAR
jgi:CheY-like chemotaxis protein